MDRDCSVDHMTHWESLEALDEDSYEYYGEVDSQPGSFDSDGLGDYEEWCAWSNADVEEGYYAHFPPDVEGRVVSLGRTRMLLLLK